jgi:hypothetical protein
MIWMVTTFICAGFLRRNEMKAERDVKACVKRFLNLHKPHVWYFMPVGTGYGKRGVPDICITVKGKSLYVETKHPKRGMKGLTELQQLERQRIETAGGVYRVVWDETTFELLRAKVLEMLAMGG